jgi:hypothetical protein
MVVVVVSGADVNLMVIMSGWKTSMYMSNNTPSGLTNRECFNDFNPSLGSFMKSASISRFLLLICLSDLKREVDINWNVWERYRIKEGFSWDTRSTVRTVNDAPINV